jgi:hypothetical protein
VYLTFVSAIAPGRFVTGSGSIGDGFASRATTIGNIDTGAGFSTIKPTSGATLTDLIFTPADDTLFTDFSFRGQLNPVDDTGIINVRWTDSLGTSGTLQFTGVPGPDRDFDRLGIVSTDETLKSVEVFTTGGRASTSSSRCSSRRRRYHRQFRNSPLG